MAKVTKSQILEGLKAMAEKFQLSVEAQSELDFTIDSYEESARNVTKEDLKVLRTVIETETGDSVVKYIPGLDNSEVKAEDKAKALPTKKKTENSVKEKPVVVPKNTEKVEDKVEDQPKETKVEKKEKSSKSQNDYLAKFPEMLVSQSLKGTLKLRSDLKTIQDVANAWANNNEDIVIATYWTKKLLKQYAQGYDPMNINPNRPTSFENDLDLIEVTYANELVVTGCSLYSFVPQIIVPSDFQADEDGMMYANGCEFAIYEVIEE